MATTMTRNQQARKMTSKVAGSAAEFDAEIPEEGKEPLKKLMSEAQAAYVSYLQAQRKVATAYQERRRLGEQEFKEIEERAAAACAQAIEEASQALLRAEQEAEAAYKEARRRAEQAYQQGILAALAARKEAVDKAWAESSGASEAIWRIFQGGTET